MSLLNFPRLKAELLLPSSFLVGYKVKPEINVLTQTKISSILQFNQQMESQLIAQLCLGRKAQAHSPRGTFLH